MTMINKGLNIATGWINWARQEIGLADDRVEKLAKVRGEICLACPHLIKKGGPGSSSKDIRIACGECGCNIAPKIRVRNEKCPVNKW